MPQFQIILTRDVTESVVLTVFASDQVSACAKALDDLPTQGWAVDDGNVWDMPLITGCDEVADPDTRADLMFRDDWREKHTDTAGNPCVWKNYYRDDTGIEWDDVWSCQCDDDDVSPYHSEWIGPGDPAERALWEALPEA